MNTPAPALDAAHRRYLLIEQGAGAAPSTS